MLRDGAVNSFLVIQHDIHQAHHRQRGPQELAAILPHLHRAVRLRLHVDRVTQRADLSTAALDTLRSPLLVTDATGRVVLANAAAEALMRRCPMLDVVGGKLVLAGPNGGRLPGMLRAACRSDTPAQASGIQGVDGAREVVLQLVVVPLPAMEST